MRGYTDKMGSHLLKMDTNSAQRANPLGNEEFGFAWSFFISCSALVGKHFGILSEASSFRKINIVPTNKYEEDRNCEIPT